jgi:hypothetical protein
MSSSPTGTTEYEVSYSLPEAFDCNQLENSSSIVFDAEYIDETKAYRIKGFTITVTAENESDMLEQANRQAERLAQIMTLKTLGHVKYTYEGHSRRTPWGTKLVTKQFTARYHIRGRPIDELNLNSNQKINSIMQDDEPTNILLYHFRLAMEAEENRQYANMYRELFQVIERDGEKKELGEFQVDYPKYKSLRAVISHQKHLGWAPGQVKEYFDEKREGSEEKEERYEFLNAEFNHNSKKNRDHLKEDAGALKKVVIEYLTRKWQ